MSKFKEVLGSKNVTQRELAKQVGISYQMISLYATGKADMGSYKVRRIARFLNVAVEDLMEEEDE